MKVRTALPLAALLMLALPAHGAGEDDEAWIVRYVGSGQAPGLVAARNGRQEVAFSELPRHVGRRARFTLADGRERRGIVESARGGQVQVRAQFGGGFFLYNPVAERNPRHSTGLTR